ncbi:ABC transporter ATP-binding protein [Candidatus Giovannonibacteria bacterium]|nr:ABC transporter ATP-binding protein [Candidatus Giovannonibacteria bacterium]
MVEFFKLFYRSFGEYKYHIALLSVLGFLSGLLGGIGINALVPLFSFVVGAETGNDDVITRSIKNIFSFLNIEFSLKYLLIFMIVLFVLKAAVLVFFSYINSRISADYEEKKRNKLFGATLEADWPYLLKQKLGYLETIFMIDLQYTKSMMTVVSSAMLVFANLLVYTFIAVNISLQTTFLTFALGGVLFLAVLRPVVSRVRRISHEDEKLQKQIAHFTNENIMGMKTVKTMFAGKAVAGKGGEYFAKVKELRIRSSIISAFSSSLLEPVSLIFISLIFALSYKAGNFNFAAFAVIMYVSKQIFVYIEQVQSFFIGTNSLIPYVERVLNYEDESVLRKEPIGGNDKFTFNRSLEFNNINFSYNFERNVLQNISFVINKGQMAGLVGPSGAGKTTLVDLLLRLLKPVSGSIILDGNNIQNISMEEWRRNIGYVSQDIFLMNDTISSNIKFYNNSITEEKMIEAAKMANIYDFISGLPEKFETVIGERGALLSGGQRQRIVIARVLARDPQLLILDEATSALDNESEVKIQKVIENLKGKITVLVIAHRLSTIMNSDKLLAIKDGKIVEEGSPEELLKNKDSYFYKVYNIRE